MGELAVQCGLVVRLPSYSTDTSSSLAMPPPAGAHSETVPGEAMPLPLEAWSSCAAILQFVPISSGANWCHCYIVIV